MECECPCSIVDWAKAGHTIARLLDQRGKVSISPFTKKKGIFFVEKVEEALFLPDLGAIKAKGGPSAMLKKWSPRENSVVLGKFKRWWV